MAHQDIPNAKPVSYAGPYRFINLVNGDVSAKTHQYEIRSHVQTKYHGWRRRDERRRLLRLDPTRRGDLLNMEPSPSHMVHDGGSAAATRDHQYHTLPSEQQVALSEIPVSNDNEERHGDELVQLHPQTLVSCGNSDPFNAFVIQVNPCVNQVLNFFFEIYMPTHYRISALPDHHVERKDYFEYSSLLGDECSAYAILTRTVQAMSPETVESSHLALPAIQFYSRCVTSLKARLAERDGTWKYGTRIAVYSLMSAAVYGGNFKEALIHGRILAHLVQKDAANSGFALCIYSFYLDYQRAAMTLTRPCFDYKTFIPDYFNPLWSAIAERMPPQLAFGELRKTLDRSIHNPTLRDIAAGGRYVYAVFTMYLTDPSFQGLQGVRFLQSYVNYVMGTMVIHYLDCRDAMKGRNSNLDHLWEDTDINNDAGFELGGDPPMPLLVQAFLVLGVLLFCRIVGQVEALEIGARRNMFSANQLIITHMKYCIAGWDRTATPAQRRKYANSHLWALYIGSQIEWAVASKRQSAAASASSQENPPDHPSTEPTGQEQNSLQDGNQTTTPGPSETETVETTPESVPESTSESTPRSTSDQSDTTVIGVAEHGTSNTQTPSSEIGPGTVEPVRPAASHPDETDEEGGAEHEFFNARMAQLAREMNLYSWAPVQDILQAGFVYTDIWPPHGSTWFYRTVGAADGGGAVREDRPEYEATMAAAAQE